ncbi:MAG: signal peptidase II [Rickettsiales bacterium]|jgi:signal peptidase II|nr:signal peptidase II [Rickettsiales bacterium]
MLKKLLAIFGIILIDQLSKGYLLYLLTGRVPLGGRFYELVPFPVMFAEITSFFNLVFTWNPGTSFSMLQSVGASAPLVIIFATSAIIGYLGHRLIAKNPPRLESLALALIVGGAVANLVDRLRFGAVVDFLDFHIGGLHWPAFNFADICISLGIAVFVYSLIKGQHHGKNIK